MKILTAIILMFFPLFSFAQISGGQIKRIKTQKTMKHPPQKQNIRRNLMAKDEKYLSMSISSLQRLSDQGDVMATFYIGYNYVQNEKFKIALEWFRKAAYHDMECAQLWLAYCYYNGKGTEKDIFLAKSWLEVAAKNGSKDANIFLNLWYK